MKQKVILVNDQDEPVGYMDKMIVHQKGLLHRAFSIFIFDKTGRMLLQKRSFQKYHGANLWTNACCSHPLPEEEVIEAAHRRLKEELGFTTHLKEIFSFIYNSKVENGLTEYEYDHVLVGEFDGEISINYFEVAEYKYEDLFVLKNKLKDKPEDFTSWFRIAFPKVEEWWRIHYDLK